MSLNCAARALGRSPAWFSGEDSVLARFNREGVAGLLPQRRRAGAKARFIVPEWFVPAASFFWLTSNRTKDGGSVPEAIRRTISLPLLPIGWTESVRKRFLKHLGMESVPVCPVELREEILGRQSKGQALVPERIALQITRPVAVVRQYRNPKNADLDFMNAPGTMMVRGSGAGGDVEFFRAGDMVEPDDSTINFPVVVPWSMGGCPCSDRYGVKVGRFQWLVSIDVGSRFVPALSYTARPRSSYRAEDVVSLVRMICRQHGVPRGFRCEQGVWKSNLVKRVMGALGCELRTVHSPHNKPFVEGLFNVMWTKLSIHFPDAHLGRFQGEHREANLLLAACQAGQKDPRRYFPMLSSAMAAMLESVEEKNRTPVKSAQYGMWVPSDRWQEHLRENPLTQLDARTDWMFAPWAIEWTVRGVLVGGRVPLFENLSVPFDFSADWLVQFHGARLRLHFDPADARCTAMAVLVNDFGRHKAGEVLGEVVQVNSVAEYARLVMGWGLNDSTAGLLARQKNAAALRREVRSVVPAGRASAVSEERNGVGEMVKVENAGGSPAPAPVRANVMREDPPLSRSALDDPAYADFIDG
jgi:hypothetical protein